MNLKKCIKNIIFVMLVMIGSIFGSERVEAEAIESCEYVGYFSNDDVGQDSLMRDTLGREYRIKISVKNNTYHIDDFDKRFKQNPEVHYDDSTGMFDPNGWTRYYPEGKKAEDEIFIHTDYMKIVESIKNGVCPTLKMYYGEKDEKIKLFNDETECDNGKKENAGAFGFLAGSCPRDKHFVTVSPRTTYVSVRQCSTEEISAFEISVAQAKEDLKAAGKTKINNMKESSNSASDIGETYGKEEESYYSARDNIIDGLQIIADGYNCKEISNMMVDAKTEIMNDADTFIKTDLVGTLNDKLNEAKSACDGDQKCIDRLYNVQQEVYEKVTGITFDKVGSDCESILGDLQDLIQQAFDLIRIAAPILLIVFGSLDFAKAVIVGDDKATKKATTDFMKRTGAAVAIFFIPFFIKLLFSLPGLESITDGINDILCGVSKVVLK